MGYSTDNFNYAYFFYFGLYIQLPPFTASYKSLFSWKLNTQSQSTVYLRYMYFNETESFTGCRSDHL